MHVALYQPSIPPNTGNIGRLCVGFDCAMHIIGPCLFDLSDKALRRAGLDYWPHLNLTMHESPESFCKWLGDRSPWLITKFGQHRFDTPAYDRDDVIVMGNEQKGLPKEWLERWQDHTVAIPKNDHIRSYNLANATAIVVSHAQLKAGCFD